MNLSASTITQVRAFEAVGRHGSFKRAAEELFVTQGALSHHVRHLEQDLGVQLIQRLHRRIELTPEGGRLLADSARALEALDLALESLRRRAADDTLTLTVPPYFSLRWLTPRLGNLWLRHPGMNLLLNHTYQTVDFIHSNIDAAITWGHGQWPEVEATLLLATRMTPLCSPGYLSRHGGRLQPGDLPGQPLFYEVDRAHWQQWFAQAGVDAVPFKAVRIDDPHALRQVVLDGHGFGLFFAELIQEDVRTGKLVQPFELCTDPGCAYYLLRPKGRPVSDKLETFTRWILEEVAKQPLP
jgi:DNA-binding transcriptional LysR family regulator